MINELIIVNESGLALFYQNFIGKSPKDYQQIAAFFTALNTFAKSGGMNDEISLIAMENNIFRIFKKDNLNFIFNCRKKELNQKILNQLIIKIANEFIGRYKEKIDKFNGEIAVFDPFTEDIDKICDIKTKKSKKSSEILKNFLGLEDKKIDYKKVLDSL